MLSMLSLRNRKWKRIFPMPYLLCLAFAATLYTVYNKPSLLATVKNISSGPLQNVEQRGKNDVCFNPNELKCSVTREQREENVWKRSFYRKRAADFEGPIEVDTSADEQKCPGLYKVAREMLDGLKVKLPHETKNTKWKFRERVDLNKLKTTHLRWNHPWDQSNANSKQTRELLKRYNVSAKSIKKRKILLSYGQNCCNGSRARAVDSAIRHAKMDYAEALDLSTVFVPFQISHYEQLRMRKGAGYWLWKSHIILHAFLHKLRDGDLIVYHDSGMYFVEDVGPLLKICEDVRPSILTFSMPYQERMYSKRDAFVLLDMDEPVVYAKSQGQRLAGLIVAMKNCETLQYFMEYLAYTMDFRISSDKPNVMGKPNFEGFVGNRHDQTVHSLLSKKWGILELRDPCTCGRGSSVRRGGYASGPYKGLYVHDRNRS